MPNVAAVFKREVKAYFTQPIAYVMMGGFLLIVGFLYYLSWRWFLGMSFEAMRNPLFRRSMRPPDGLFIILRDAVTLDVHQAKV